MENNHNQEVRLYNGLAPGSEHWDWVEKSGSHNSIGLQTISNVADPALIVFEPEHAKKNGTALVICPGGGFHFLAIEHEGTNIARALVEKGISVFVLKYRLFYTATDNPFDEMLNTQDKIAWDAETEPVKPLAIADGREAIAFLRRNAARYGISAQKIGIMGFSAGGLVAASAAFGYNTANKPDFVIPVYPDMPDSRQSPIQPDAPPIFLLCASDDEFGFPVHVISLYNRWFNAKRPVEMHIFSKGGHGFGPGTIQNTTYRWVDQLVKWLEAEGFIPAA
ncbi:MAG: alpha/beta hydrolase [Chitinophagaceae bacterium]|nr:MAG: alpha/beta hydrolase [Chitinophagaceae bacterium]